jgi:hypothetical protein
VKSGQIIGDVMKFGHHDRAVVYNGSVHYDQIIQAEMSGELIERLPNAQEEKGESLVMGMRHPRDITSSTDKLPVAASTRVRDQVQVMIGNYVHQKARMAVLEYQP